MDSSILSPQPGQTVVTATHGHPHYPYPRNDLDDLIVSEQAAFGRAEAEAARDLTRDVKDSACEIVRTTDRQTADVLDAIGKASAYGAEAFERACDRTHKVADLVRETSCEVKQRINDLEIRESDRWATLRMEQSAQHCEIKQLVQAEACKTRELVSEYRIRELEARLARRS
jgi:hypothetical protein